MGWSRLWRPSFEIAVARPNCGFDQDLSASTNGPIGLPALVTVPGSSNIVTSQREGIGLRVVGVVVWSQFRTRWRSWLAVVILISVVGGVVLAAVAAGRRTESAFPGFVRAHGFDADVFSTAPIGQKISQLPGVRAVTEAVGPGYNGQPTCACTHPINPSYFGVVVVSPKERSIFSLVSGRLPNPSNPNEVLASYTLQQDEGLHLGSVVRVPFYSRAQESAYDNATGPLPEPTGPTAALRIVGFEATETEFPYGSNPTYFLYATPAFARTVLPRTIIGHVYFVQLRDGAADLPRIDAAAKNLGSILFVQPLDYQVASVEASIRPQAVGWWLLAALAALVGLAVIGQALGRQSLAESEDFPTLAALGLQRRQLVALGNSRNLATGLAGAVGAMVLATLLSPIAPLGEARSAESSTGITFDLLVLMLGGISIVIVVVDPGSLVSHSHRSHGPGQRPHRQGHPVEARQSSLVGRRADESRARSPQRARAQDRGDQRSGR